ncbi:hypothetical protein BASA83_013665 [Batrachochytrium salamandrivorans]|nr:hypothetical protein BASA83_013665 [Batrachochytrium salamandrivorans]
MKKRGGFDENTPDYYFKVGDMVKMKHHDCLKLEFRWKAPITLFDVDILGLIGSWTPQGLRLAECSPPKSPMISLVYLGHLPHTHSIPVPYHPCPSTQRAASRAPSSPCDPNVCSTTLNTISSLLNSRGKTCQISRKLLPLSPTVLRSLELENQALQQVNHFANPREPKAALPDKFDGSRRSFRGFINQLELVFQLQDQRYDTDRKKIATLGTLLTDKALSWYNPYIERPEHYAQGNQPCAIYAAEFRQLTADIDWNDAALRSQFYSGLSSEIKDHLVHCETSISLSVAMDQAIRIDNRIVERRQEQQYVSRPFRRNPPLSHFVPRSNTNQYSPTINQRMTWTLISPGGAHLHPSKGNDGMSQRLCLVCGQSGHLKATCPKSNSRFGSQRHVQAIEMDDSNVEMSGNDLGRL